MDLLKRTISLILVFQLCWACNGASSKSSGVVNTGGASSSSTSTTISGTITGLMDLVMASAVAQTGDIIFEDITDPDNILGIHSEKLVGTKTFSIKLNRSGLSGGKLIRATYTSSDSAEDSRTLLFNVAGTESSVNASMDADKTFSSLLLEKQLQREKDSSKITGADYLDRFKAIKNDDHSNEFEVLGSDKMILKKLMLDPNLSANIADLLAYMKEGRESGDLGIIRDAKLKLYHTAIDYGFMKAKPILNCFSREVSFLFRDQNMNISVKGLDLEVMRAYGTRKDYGGFDNAQTASESINDLLLNLAKIGEEAGKIVSAQLYFTSKDGVPFAGSCRVFSKALTASEMAAAKMPSYQIELDKSGLLNFDVTLYSSGYTIQEISYKVGTIYEQTLNDFKSKIRDAVSNNEIDANDAQLIYVAGMDAASDLYDQKFLAAYEVINPSSLRSNPYGPNISFVTNIFYGNFVSSGDPFGEADRETQMAYWASYDDIKYRIYNDGFQPNDYEIDRSYNLLKEFAGMKQNQFKWYIKNYYF